MRSMSRMAVPGCVAPPGSTDAACGLQHNCGFHVRNCICSEIRSVFGDHTPQGIARFALGTGQEFDHESLPKSPVLAVLTGAVGIVSHLSDGRRTITGLFLPGDYINLSALEQRMSGTITALAPSAIHLMEQHAFERLFDISGATRSHFLDQTNRFLFRLLDHSNDLAKKTPVERIAAFIFELQSRISPPGDAQLNRVTIPFGRRDIADYLGLQPETVSRCFTSLIREDAISLPEADVVLIENVQRLRQIANGGRPRKRAP